MNLTDNIIISSKCLEYHDNNVIVNLATITM